MDAVCAVAGDDDDVHLRPDGLDGLRHRQGATMQGVDRLVLEVAAHPPGAADAGHDDRVAFVEPHLIERHGQHHHDRADATARTPDGREQVELEPILVGHVGHRRLRHGRSRQRSE